MAIRADTDDIITFLNDLFALDPHFMNELVSRRIACSDAIGDHPTVQAMMIDGRPAAGLIGILNGYFGTFDDGHYKGYGPITALFSDGKLTGFIRTDSASRQGG